MELLEPLRLAGRSAPNRLLFGPHVTNLGRDRSISDRHVAYYRRRAAGGAGVVVCEEASVHPSDWPYERSPLASECGEGWAAVASAVHAEGGLALAGLGHTGGQGSSAYSQSPLWAPSRVPEVNSREVPKWMEEADVLAVVEGFASAAGLAAGAGLDGVEVNAGQFSLVRQFLSGLTNHRSDRWGEDRAAFAREVLAAVRHAVGADRVVGLRLSCDELAPWAGLTPEMAAGVAVELAPHVDYLVVVRGSIFTASATRPDMHTEPGFNVELCRSIRAALREAGHDLPVVLQGSVVDPARAELSLRDGVCDAVEMTRAQIADPALGAKLAAGAADQVRPCILCNQLCEVRDSRNPLVSCVGEPSSGHELDDPAPVPDGPHEAPPAHGPTVVVIGGGPAGMEAARVARLRGRPVRLAERSARLGGAVPVAASASGRARLAELAAWQASECKRLGVDVELGSELGRADVEAALAEGGWVVMATGAAPGARTYEVEAGAADAVETASAFLTALGADGARSVGDVVVVDPIGGPVGVSVAETVAALPGERAVRLVTPDHVAGNELARTGDLAPANVRLQQAGVDIVRRSVVRAVRAAELAGTASVVVEVEERYTGARTTVPAALVIDAGFALPGPTPVEPGGRSVAAGDAVAPRSIHEAVLEGRRAVIAAEGRS